MYSGIAELKKLDHVSRADTILQRRATRERSCVGKTHIDNAVVNKSADAFGIGADKGAKFHSWWLSANRMT
jgi:hypothetical protein